MGIRKAASVSDGRRRTMGLGLGSVTHCLREIRMSCAERLHNRIVPNVGMANNEPEDCKVPSNNPYESSVE
jgi:hypothetical protein